MDQFNALAFLNTVERVKYAQPSCCTSQVPQSSQTAAEHMFRHALICLIIPLNPRVDRAKLVTMALIHDVTDFRSWDGEEHRKRLNMEFLACDLPPKSAKGFRDCWTEYWDGETEEAKLSQEICAFEHMVTVSEDRIQPVSQLKTSSSELRQWMSCIESSEEQMVYFKNGASFGSSYWVDPDENMRLLAEVVSKDNPATTPVAFVRMARCMSTIKRKGWLKRGMKPLDVESNAAHSWGVAVICLLFSLKDEAFNCAILGLIHDLGEIVIGDVIPSDHIGKMDKTRHERFGQTFLVHVSRSSTLEQLFTEFEDRKSIAAQVAHEADSLECRIQAVTYIQRYPLLKRLHEFLQHTPTTAYFQDLRSLLAVKESLLQGENPPLTVVFIIGGPGVGKDTLCAKLAEELGFCHIPTGDLLRKEIDRPGSRYSNFIQKSIDIGFAVPANLMISLLIAAATGQKWLVNGFPRSLDQLFVFEQHVTRVYSTLLLHCSREVLKQRLLQRAKSSTRSDDMHIEKRLDTYKPGNDVEMYLEQNGQSGGRFRRIVASGSEADVLTLAKEAVEGVEKEV